MGFSITALAAELNDDPFFRFRMARDQLALLRDELLACARRPREWFTLAATYENPARLRLKRDLTPDFEEAAAPLYLRGDSFRITGAPGRSCNITFSSVAAQDLARRLDEAKAQMNEFVELRVRSRRHPLIEFIPDGDLPRQGKTDDDTLARASESAGADALGREDFSDWDV